MAPLSNRAQRLVRAAKALHGDRYATAMAESMGLSQTYITLMTKAGPGGKPVTDKVEGILLRTLQAERKRLKAVSAELAVIIAEIQQDAAK
jgi:hypothetical protein